MVFMTKLMVHWKVGGGSVVDGTQKVKKAFMFTKMCLTGDCKLNCVNPPFIPKSLSIF